MAIQPPSSSRGTSRTASSTSIGGGSSAPVESVEICHSGGSTNGNSDDIDKFDVVRVCIRMRPLLPSDYRCSNNNGGNGLTTTPSTAIKTHTSGLATPTSVKSALLRRGDNETNELQQSPAWILPPSSNNTISPSSTTNTAQKTIPNYTFDRVYGPNDTTESLYTTSIGGIVKSVVDGLGHGCVLAYGQTNSGKTYTMTGMRGGSSAGCEEEGVIRMAVQDIFRRVQMCKQQREYLLRVSYLEIYNEQIYDLLALPSVESPLRIFESRTEGVVVRGLREEIVTCPEDVFALLDDGDMKRKVGSTGMNRTSSRSHSVFRLVLESRASSSSMNNGLGGGIPPSSASSVASDAGDSVASGRSSITQSLGTAVKGPVRISSLSLVDLAGSESVKATGSTGVRQKEGQYINKSLLTLGHVVHKLSEMSSRADKDSFLAKEHIPYRDSKLTRLLQPSLGGNARVCIVANISPALANLEESHNTLKFATRAKRIQQHARITEVADEKTLLRSYREEIEELKRQLKKAKRSAADMAQTPTKNVSFVEVVDRDGGDSDSSDEEDQDDTHVLVSAIANLENLILKAGASSKSTRKLKEASSTEESTFEAEDALLPNRTLFDAALTKVESEMNSDSNMSSPTMMGNEMNKSQLATPTQDHDEDSHNQLLGELHRIQGMLGYVMKKRKDKPNASARKSMGGTSAFKTPQRDEEVERLRLQLQEQEVTTTMRKADSSFLQGQLDEKESLLKEVSILLEALEKRQLALESENAQLREDLAAATALIEEGDAARDALIEKLAEKQGFSSEAVQQQDTNRYEER
eukprot:g9002.t1 g9002   contig34:609471-611977(-)